MLFQLPLKFSSFIFSIMLSLSILFTMQSMSYAQVLKYELKKVPPKEAVPKDTIPADSVSYENKRQRIEQNNQPLERFVKSSDLEVDGLIVDETITKIGRDFYELFNRQWEAPPDVKNYTILIQERPTRGNGAFIHIIINDEPVFEYVLQPRYDLIEEVSSYAVALLMEYVVNNQLNQQLEAEGRKAREVF